MSASISESQDEVHMITKLLGTLCTALAAATGELGEGY